MQQHIQSRRCETDSPGRDRISVDQQPKGGGAGGEIQSAEMELPCAEAASGFDFEIVAAQMSHTKRASEVRKEREREND